MCSRHIALSIWSDAMRFVQKVFPISRCRFCILIDGHNDRLDMGTAPPFPRRFATDSADQWPDHVRLSDLEARFVCKACGKKGADVRPDFNWNENPVAAMGYR